MQAIVIAESSEERDFLSYVLRHGGLAVARAASVELVESTLLKEPLDLIVFSGRESHTTIKDVTAIRAVSQVTLLLLHDPLTENQTCELLDAGVDLVLERPYSPRVLVRYASKLLRRAGSVPASMLMVLEAGDVKLDPGTRMVALAGGEPKPLTPLEFRLLYVLMTNADQVIPVELIIERVWGYQGEGSRELVRGLVRRLRRKIEPDPQQTQIIHNHPGVGYRFSV